jgi:SagB-type dehydrogenase family enzyme
MLTRVDSSGRAAEDASPVLQTWHFADLLFHSRCRAGRHDEPSDVFGFRGRLPYLPAVKAPMSRETIDLDVPDLAALQTHDVPFTRVLEERRSIREYDARPITLTQLGEFLYRVARVKRVIEPDGERLLYQASVRPYPGGGACYELETYVAANRCEGLPVGLYHYDPLNHRLERIASSEAHIPEFMRDTLIPVDVAGPRQLLIILAARFQRIAWKYNGSTYAAILKNAGVLYQTMYLVATAMNLAPCGIGGGNSELFARATGVPFVEETSVGEFMLGSRPARD